MLQKEAAKVIRSQRKKVEGVCLFHLSRPIALRAYGCLGFCRRLNPRWGKGLVLDLLDYLNSVITVNGLIMNQGPAANLRIITGKVVNSYPNKCPALPYKTKNVAC